MRILQHGEGAGSQARWEPSLQTRHSGQRTLRCVVADTRGGRLDTIHTGFPPVNGGFAVARLWHHWTVMTDIALPTEKEPKPCQRENDGSRESANAAHSGWPRRWLPQPRGLRSPTQPQDSRRRTPLPPRNQPSAVLISPNVVCRVATLAGSATVAGVYTQTGDGWRERVLVGDTAFDAAGRALGCGRTDLAGVRTVLGARRARGTVQRSRPLPLPWPTDFLPCRTRSRWPIG